MTESICLCVSFNAFFRAIPKQPASATGKRLKDYREAQLERTRDICSWTIPPARPWPAERHFAYRETHWRLLLPALVTAALVVWAGVFADSLSSPLAWLKLIAKREYGP